MYLLNIYGFIHLLFSYGLNEKFPPDYCVMNACLNRITFSY